MATLPSPTPFPAIHDKEVDGDVDGNRHYAEHELNGAGKSWRVEDRKKILLHEPALVSGRSTGGPQSVFEWSQRADPALELDDGDPGGCGQVNPQAPLPPQPKQAAEQRIENEHEVGDDDQVGEQSVEHGSVAGRGRSANCVGRDRRHKL